MIVVSETVYVDNAQIDYGNNEDNMYFSHYNITNEKSEDYCCATFSDEYDKDLKVIAIFDGMGGTKGEEIASLASTKQMPILFLGGTTGNNSLWLYYA